MMARGGTDASPRTNVRGSRAWLPSPLAGEGLGERGGERRGLCVPPSPQPLSREGRGAYGPAPDVQ